MFQRSRPDMGPGGPYTYEACTSAQHRRKCSTCRNMGSRFCQDYFLIREEEDRILAAELKRRQDRDRIPTVEVPVTRSWDLVDPEGKVAAFDRRPR